MHSLCRNKPLVLSCCPSTIARANTARFCSCFIYSLSVYVSSSKCHFQISKFSAVSQALQCTTRKTQCRYKDDEQEKASFYQSKCLFIVFLFTLWGELQIQRFLNDEKCNPTIQRGLQYTCFNAC